MAKLRQKLRVKVDDSAIAETVWGVGYRLRIESF
jgi:DNA-binding response OmpR family regulator